MSASTVKRSLTAGAKTATTAELGQPGVEQTRARTPSSRTRATKEVSGCGSRRRQALLDLLVGQAGSEASRLSDDVAGTLSSCDHPHHGLASEAPMPR